MVPIARRFLLADGLRLALSVAGMSISVTVVAVLGGLVEGITRQVTAYVENSAGDYYICQKGIVNFLGAGSVIPKATARKVAAVRGVTAAAPLLVRTTLLEMPDHRVQAVVFGYEPAKGGGRGGSTRGDRCMQSARWWWIAPWPSVTGCRSAPP
jgi:putative ABC transport system permease protein